jgi:hypothetical protein
MKYFLSLVLLSSLLQGADISKIEVWYQAQDDGPYYLVIVDAQLKLAVGSHIAGQFDNEIPLSSDAVHNIKLYMGDSAKGDSNKVDNPDSAIKIVVTQVDGKTLEKITMFTNRDERESNYIFKFFNDMCTVVKYFKHMK